MKISTSKSKVEKDKCDTYLSTVHDRIGLITEISWLC